MGNQRNVWPPCNKNSDDPVYVDGTTRFQHFLHNEKADVRKIKNEHVKLVNRLLFSFHNFFSVCRIITTLVFSSTSISVATLFSFAFSSSYFFYSDSDDRSLLFQSIFYVISLVNNIAVTVLLSKIICKTYARPGDTSMPIPNVYHPQQLTFNWAGQLTGQQPQQFQSSLNPTIVFYSPHQHQPSMNPQEHQQHPPCAFFSTAANRTEFMNNSLLTNTSPPPYSTASALLDPQEKDNYNNIKV